MPDTPASIAANTAAARPARCPICKAAVTDPVTRPFCSKRCADTDLHRWFSGGYAVPVEESDDEDGEGPRDSSDSVDAER